MHDIGIIITGKDEAGTAHIGGKLICFIERLVNDLGAETRVP